MRRWTKAVLIQPAIDRVFIFLPTWLQRGLQHRPRPQLWPSATVAAYISGSVNAPETAADSLPEKIISDS
jgi:hypothetical protein